MKLLVVDTGGAEAVAAAIESGPDGAARLVGLGSLDDPRLLSRQVIACFEAAMSAACWSVDQLEAIAVGAGPGSWTGLRIGFSACKTLAQARAIPLLALSSTDAIAQAAWRRQPHAGLAHPSSEVARPDRAVLLVVGPCRPGEVYGATYLCEGDSARPAAREAIAPLAEMVEAACDLARESGLAPVCDQYPILVAGAAREQACQALQQRARVALGIEVSSAAMILELGRGAIAALQHGAPGAPLDAAPLYLAPSAAERALAALGRTTVGNAGSGAPASAVRGV